ncbi:MAG: radical SAM protein [Conexivisphaerales archaeon]|nr:radical SAM protein [Conexivisphaerales archaeon]
MTVPVLRPSAEGLVKPGEEYVRSTLSVCPYCSRLLPAAIVARDNKVYIRKRCPEHGEIEEVYWSDYEMYRRFLRYWHDGKGTAAPTFPLQGENVCTQNCGLCPYHINHTALANIVVTNRCDLTCWYCFFYARRDKGGFVYEPSLDQIVYMVRTLRAEKPVPGNSVQITGGEPTLRDDLPDIIRAIKSEGIDHIQLNTNGIRIAQHPELCRTYREAGVSNLYLSFDGVTPRTNSKNHWEVPYVLDACRGANLGVVLVPTVIRGHNDHELGAIVRYAQRNADIVRAVNFQPVSLTGLMPREQREKYRITIPDVIHAVEEQTGGEVPSDAWFPVPSSTPVTHVVEALTNAPKYELSIHPHCGAGTYVFIDKSNNRLVPITSFIKVKELLNDLQELAEKVQSGENKYLAAAHIALRLQSYVIKEKEPPGVDVAKMLTKALLRHDYSSVGEFHMRSLFLGIMHFQDLYNHDAERVQRCDIHYLNPDGRIIPFCSYNVQSYYYRDLIMRKYGIPIEEWERRNGRRLESGLYRGELRRGKHHPNCGCDLAPGASPAPSQGS